MITRLEAIRYRCFERLAIDLSNFQVIVGANGAGKTTLLDLPVLFGDLLRATTVAPPSVTSGRTFCLARGICARFFLPGAVPASLWLSRLLFRKASPTMFAMAP